MNLPATPSPATVERADQSRERRVVLALVGPTATGKTALALALAELLPVEVVSADSRMVCRWMDIGTAKPTPEERALVPHHLVDVVDPDEPYSVALFKEQALAAIARIQQRGQVPIVAGGTGLYVRAVCDGLEIPAVPPDPDFRRRMEERAARQGWQALEQELMTVDPESARRIEPRNVRRVIRALEVYHATGRPFSSWQQRQPVPFDTLYIGLNLPRDVLYRRIDQRAAEQVDAGLVDEVRALLSRGYDSSMPAMMGFGYREMAQYLRGEIDREAALQQYQQATRHYARRQLTWFRSDERIHWLDARQATAREVAERYQTFRDLPAASRADAAASTPQEAALDLSGPMDDRELPQEETG